MASMAGRAELVAGSAWTDITPREELYMGGFGQRTSPSSGVLDPLSAKAVYLGGPRGSLLLIGLDLIHVPGSLARAIKQRLASQAAVSSEAICIAASHTHSGPDLRPRDERHRRYLNGLTEAVVRTGLKAVQTARPARLHAGVGKAELMRNRRTRGRPNDVDHRIPVLQIVERHSSLPVAVVFGCACHPVTLGWRNMAISADYPGHAQSAVERAFPGTVALFVNVASGDVIPRSRPNADALDPRGYADVLHDEAADLGGRLAAEVIRVIADASPVTDSQPRCVQRECRIADAYLGSGAALRARAHSGDASRSGWSADELQEQLTHEATVIMEFLGAETGVTTADAHLESTALWARASEVVIRRRLPESEMCRLMAAVCRYRLIRSRCERDAAQKHLVPVQVMQLGEFRFVALPGEPLVAVGRDWQRRCSSDLGFVIGYANSHFQYLPHPTQFGERDWWGKYETIANDLAPEATEILLDTAEEICSAPVLRA